MPNAPTLEYLEVGASRDDADLSVILLHGLGADGHDFREVARMLHMAAHPRQWRFVLPHAPRLPVTINHGMAMPAWYDILDLSHPRAVDWDTVDASRRQLEALIDAETCERILLAGFSQGGAMTLELGLRRPTRYTGLLVMSGYLLESEERPVPPASTPSLPIGLFHGRADDVVPITAAETSVASLEAAGHAPTLSRYEGLGHSVSQDVIRDVFDWLKRHGE